MSTNQEVNKPKHKESQNQSIVWTHNRLQDRPRTSNDHETTTGKKTIRWNAEHRLNIYGNVLRIPWWAGKRAAGVIIRRDGEPGTCCHQGLGRNRAKLRHGVHQESHVARRHYGNPRNVVNITGIPWNAVNMDGVPRNLPRSCFSSSEIPRKSSHTLSSSLRCVWNELDHQAWCHSAARSSPAAKTSDIISWAHAAN